MNIDISKSHDQLKTSEFFQLQPQNCFSSFFFFQVYLRNTHKYAIFLFPKCIATTLVWAHIIFKLKSLLSGLTSL